MARLSKCKGCDKELHTDERYKYSNKTYCKKCYDFKIAEKQSYDNLISWICTYFGENKPNGLILKQIKEYKDKFDYTYSGIHYCLWYLVEIKNVRIDKKYGIALVKFEYENSKTYFEQQQNIKNSIVKPVENEIIKKVKLKSNNKIKSKFLLNLDDLV